VKNSRKREALHARENNLITNRIAKMSMNSKRDGMTMKRVFLSADKRAVEFFDILYEIFMVLAF
jgi:hypothetical protein